MSEPFVGEIRLFAGNFAPVDWALCNGALLKINDYQPLFTLLGTTYGGGGVTDFALPNLCARVPVGIDQRTGQPHYTIGQSGGADVVTLDTSTMPNHTHPLMATTSPATDTTLSTNSYYASVTNNQSVTGLYVNAAAAALTPKVMNNAVVGNTGGGAAHSNVMPSLVVNYIICLKGTYPQRS